MSACVNNSIISLYSRIICFMSQVTVIMLGDIVAVPRYSGYGNVTNITAVCKDGFFFVCGIIGIPLAGMKCMA